MQQRRSNMKSTSLELAHVLDGSQLPTVVAAALLIGVTCVAYLPAMNGKFLFDDDVMLTSNELIQDSDGLYRFWFTLEPLDYWPVSNTSLWLEWRMWGMKPFGYHVINLALHLGAALLLWAVLRKLSIPGAYLAALFWAIHPVNVESVAWISQRKTVLATVFFLLSILWYLKGESQRGTVPFCSEDVAKEGQSPRLIWRWYWLSLLAFVLGMLSKGSIAILPLVLLLIAWWQSGEITVREIARTAPFFVVAAVLVVVNIWFQNHEWGESTRSITPLERLLGAAVAVWFYLFKAVAPIHLLFFYPQWEIHANELRWWLPLLAAIAVTAGLCWRRETAWGRAILFAWGYFCIALVPVLGFTDVAYMRFAMVADHYQYVALMSVTALVAAGVAWGWAKFSLTARCVEAAGCVVLVAALAVLSWRQSGLYRDAITLYQGTLAGNPTSWLAHNNLGKELLDLNEIPEAVEHLQEALRLHPDYAAAHFNLGNVLVKLQRMPEAVEQFQEAVRIRPYYAKAHDNLGLALFQTGQPEAAIEHLRMAVKLKTRNADAQNNLGLALFNTGQTHEAFEHLSEAVRLNPDFPNAQYNLGNLYLKLGRPPEAIDRYQVALRLNPEFAQAHNNLGMALMGLSQQQEALQHFQSALQYKPEFPMAQFNLGQALLIAGKTQEGIAAAAKALKMARAQGQAPLAQEIEEWLNANSTLR